MKKRVIVFAMLLLCLPIVSAGFFNNFFDNFAGPITTRAFMLDSIFKDTSSLNTLDKTFENDQIIENDEVKKNVVDSDKVLQENKPEEEKKLEKKIEMKVGRYELDDGISLKILEVLRNEDGNKFAVIELVEDIKNVVDIDGKKYNLEIDEGNNQVIFKPFSEDNLETNGQISYSNIASLPSKNLFEEEEEEEEEKTPVVETKTTFSKLFGGLF